MKVKFFYHQSSHEVEAAQTKFKMNEDVSSIMHDDQYLPVELEKTVLCFLLMAVVLSCNLLSTAVIHDRTPNTNSTENPAQRYPPLRDITFDISASIRGNYAFQLVTITEVILVVSTIFVIGLLTFHKHKSIVFRRMFFLLSLLFIVRLLTMNATMLPVSSNTLYACQSGNDKYVSGSVIISRFFDLLLKFGLSTSSLTGTIKYCGNFVYSGYAVILVLNCLIVGEYFDSWIISLPMKALTVCSLFLILISGFDYTISVIIAYYTTTRLFWIYHTMANNISLKEPKEKNTNQICKEWWYPIFLFLEGNVRAVVPPVKYTFRRV